MAWGEGGGGGTWVMNSNFIARRMLSRSISFALLRRMDRSSFHLSKEFVLGWDVSGSRPWEMGWVGMCGIRWGGMRWGKMEWVEMRWNLMGWAGVEGGCYGKRYHKQEIPY